MSARYGTGERQSAVAVVRSAGSRRGVVGDSDDRKGRCVAGLTSRLCVLRSGPTGVSVSLPAAGRATKALVSASTLVNTGPLSIAISWSMCLFHITPEFSLTRYIVGLNC